jgi:hypothetical protein
MPRTKRNTEFDKWWKEWSSKFTQDHLTGERRVPVNELDHDVERTAGAKRIILSMEQTPKALANQ